MRFIKPKKPKVFFIKPKIQDERKISQSIKFDKSCDVIITRVKKHQKYKTSKQLQNMSYYKFLTYCKNAGVKNAFMFEDRIIVINKLKG